ncbi:insecticidal delta-endotoxin Cry8Ea1 family protein [Proteus faecis]|uniref:insecticidal delta-endotoxin Cry8Ea1 family protein n=1 Tax=Proteus faecis TaxID=2050967 RepID=UPI0021BB16CF|nr:insecticidal delta-endotoxin Cry8Ea1 family protein [Proteus faecis]MCT8250174.1 insecticidal delta-endotoxin Cry8Ea1 family protein [Proteus faecis]
MSSTLKLNDGLSDIGAIIHYGISQIPVVGGVLSTIFGLLWPTDKEDIWSTIKQEVQSLINEDIQEDDWDRLVAAVSELQDKVSFINDQLINAQYDTAGPELMTVVVDIVGIEENFKIKGTNFKYAFAPLFVAVMNLKIALYLEGIKYSNELGLTQDQVNQLKLLLQSDVQCSKSYLSPINSEIGSTYLNNIQTYFSVKLYYGTSVSLFNELWSEDYEDYNAPAPLENYYVPAMAAGSFYKLISLDGQNYSVPMAFAEVADNSMMPSTNILGSLYQEPTSYPDGYINFIDVYTDLSVSHRTTGLMFTCSGSDEQYEMGMTPNNNDSFNVGQNTMSINVDGGEFINQVSVRSESFVSQIEFTTNLNNTMVAGQHPDDDSMQEVTLVSPFSINSMYVVSDAAGYIQSSGHQMCGLAISAIYNNELAMQYVSSLYKNS